VIVVSGVELLDLDGGRDCSSTVTGGRGGVLGVVEGGGGIVTGGVD
jgi:hypothetical protein